MLSADSTEVVDGSCPAVLRGYDCAPADPGSRKDRTFLWSQAPHGGAWDWTKSGNGSRRGRKASRPELCHLSCPSLSADCRERRSQQRGGDVRGLTAALTRLLTTMPRHRVAAGCARSRGQLALAQPDIAPRSVAEARQLPGNIGAMSLVLVGAGPQSHWAT